MHRNDNSKQPAGLGSPYHSQYKHTPSQLHSPIDYGRRHESAQAQSPLAATEHALDQLASRNRQLETQVEALHNQVQMYTTGYSGSSASRTPVNSFSDSPSPRRTSSPQPPQRMMHRHSGYQPSSGSTMNLPSAPGGGGGGGVPLTPTTPSPIELFPRTTTVMSTSTSPQRRSPSLPSSLPASSTSRTITRTTTPSPVRRMTSSMSTTPSTVVQVDTRTTARPMVESRCDDDIRNELQRVHSQLHIINARQDQCLTAITEVLKQQSQMMNLLAEMQHQKQTQTTHTTSSSILGRASPLPIPRRTPSPLMDMHSSPPDQKVRFYQRTNWTNEQIHRGKT